MTQGRFGETPSQCIWRAKTHSRAGTSAKGWKRGAERRRGKAIDRQDPIKRERNASSWKTWLKPDAQYVSYAGELLNNAHVQLRRKMRKVGYRTGTTHQTLSTGPHALCSAFYAMICKTLTSQRISARTATHTSPQCQHKRVEPAGIGGGGANLIPIREHVCQRTPRGRGHHCEISAESHAMPLRKRPQPDVIQNW